MIEPSDNERAEWPDTTRAYVEAIEARDLLQGCKQIYDSGFNAGVSAAVRVITDPANELDFASELTGPVTALLVEVGEMDDLTHNVILYIAERNHMKYGGHGRRTK